MITFETQPDRRRLTAGLRRAYRRTLLPFRLCPLIALLPALVGLLSGDLIKAGVWALAAVALVLVAPLTLRALVRANWKMHGLPITWTFTDEGVRSVNAVSDGTLSWAAIERVEAIPGQLLFWIGRAQVFPVPVDGLAAADRERLLAFLRERGLLTGDPAALAGPADPR
ncbi:MULTISPECIES: YcxB family protein [unclassified Micromonospora]|uniref:YcxB family protein n=1 Tax=unclassified Micromonospora TaxID=2617518 RepID=UPI003327F17D